MNEFLYQPFYCEENVWHLCGHPEVGGPQREVVFITNPAKTVALWEQRASELEEGLVAWDYHVVLATGGERGWQVWDLDSRLPWGTSASRYLERTFRPVRAELRPAFRAVQAAVYQRTFASDRSHMRSQSGVWARPSPPWPRIGQGHNLERFVDLDDPFVGRVLTLEQLRQRLAG